MTIRNALSIDVEDYFQVSAFSSVIDPQAWDSLECRVERNVDALLNLLDRRSTKATFFTLGWIAERYPHLVRAIVNAGHELASHGYGHQKVNGQTPAQFRDDVLKAKQLLEQIGGTRVLGYRAPSFSIDASNPWAHDVLQETGHIYSSSVYPIVHDHYGMPDAPRFAWEVRPGLLEIPATTMRLGSKNLPASGGGYFRLLPYAMSRWSISRINRLDQQPVVFYFHPWEIDPEQPRVAEAPLKSRFRHYVNLAHMLGKLDRLIQDFQWDRVDRVYANHAPALRDQGSAHEAASRAIPLDQPQRKTA